MIVAICEPFRMVHPFTSLPTMSSRSRRNYPPLPAEERRLGMARRMPQLATSRGLVFLVGAICLAFGLIALYLERDAKSRLLLADQALRASGQVSQIIPEALALATQRTQRFYGIIAAYGGITLGLAYALFRIPLVAPVIATILLALVFVSFLLLHRSDQPVWYVLGGFLLLSFLIKAIQNGHQFHQSYARMGRPTDQ
jgi:hypothetical protein